MKLRNFSVSHVLHYDSLNVQLTDGDSGMHILYGPNETGKTTLLNLIVDWLYGGRISEPVVDYYSSESLLAGMIDDGHGKLMKVGRKKRYSRLELTDRSVSEDELMQLLAGYDRERFTLIFGFDHERLRNGGESLLQSGGHAGVSLFEAGGGIQHLHNLLTNLDARTRDLLDPSFRAQSKKLLNKHWGEFLVAQRDIRKSSLGAQDWVQQRQAIAGLEAEIQHLRKERYDVQRRLEQLQRLGRLQTMLPELTRIREKLQQFGSVTVWEDAEEERVTQVVQAHNNLELERVRIAKHIQQLRAKLEDLVSEPEVTAQEAAIQKMNQGLAQYETRRRNELPRLAANKHQREDQIVFRIKDLVGDTPSIHVDMLRIPFADIEYVKQLMEQIKDASQTLRHQEERYQELQEQQNETQRQLHNVGAVAKVSALRELVEQIRQAGNLDDMIAQIEDTIRSERQSMEQMLSHQSEYSGNLYSMASLVVPLDATIDRFHSEWDIIRDQHRELERKRQQLEDQWDAYQRELETLELQGHVPIESELTEIRRLRDHGWNLIKRRWFDHAGDDDEFVAYTEGSQLETVFESYLYQADEIADRLRLHADKSARRALLLLEKSQNEEQREQLTERLQAIRQEGDKVKKSWSAKWPDSNINVKTPAEMKEWLATVYRPVIQGLQKLATQERELQELTAQRGAFLEELSEQTRKYYLTLPEEGLRAQTRVCESYVREMEDRQKEAERLRQDLSLSDRRLEKEQVMLNRYRQNVANLEEAWREWADRYPFVPRDCQIASLYIQKLEELFKWEQDKQEVEREIGEKEVECTTFEEHARLVGETLNDPITDFSQIFAWMAHIRQKLERAKGIETKRRQLVSQIEEHEDEFAQVKEKADELTTLLREALAHCHCSNAEELLQHIEISKRIKELRQAQRNLEESIRLAGDGLPLNELEEEFAQVEHPEELKLLTEEVRAELDKMTTHEEEYKQRLQDMQMQFRLLSGDKTLAAETAQKAEYHLAEIDRIWTEYLRVELARRLLQRTIESYRQQNESAIIAEANNFFRRLTLNHYTHLTVEYDHNTPYLEARHRSEGRRRVNQMSDGTRDQLYLALRLAFINQHLSKGQALPLIMDDILVHFDDDRTQATLEVLNELARRTQILYFTHHQLVIDKALELRPQPAQVHYLTQMV